MSSKDDKSESASKRKSRRRFPKDLQTTRVVVPLVFAEQVQEYADKLLYEKLIRDLDGDK